jgi:hypothetical protein
VNLGKKTPATPNVEDGVVFEGEGRDHICTAKSISNIANPN